MAVLGNNFWERRSKHGRDKLFATPELMWNAACEYFKFCVNNPLIAIEYHGKNADEKEVPKIQAFTLHGLCLYLDCATSYFREFKSNIKSKGEDKTQTDLDFLTVIVRIEETVYHQKFIHAAAGFLNANIIARDLGLNDTTNLNHGGQPNGDPIKIVTGMIVT